MLAYATQVAVAIFEITVLPQGRTFARRDDGACPALMNGFVAGASIKSAIAIDTLDGRLDLFEMARQRARVNDIGVGEQGRDDLLRVGIQADVEFAPAAAVILAVGADLPLAFAEDFQTGGINDEVSDGLG